MSEDLAKFLNLWVGVGILSLVGGAMFTLGCATVCRLLSWAPINITVNNHTTARPKGDDEVAA
jgi:hypothetical protein